MNRKLFLSAICLVTLLVSSCTISRNSTIGKLPPLKDVAPILDSITAEGYQLYFSERANWIATDLVHEKHSMEELGRSLSYQPNDSCWTVSFLDSNNENCVFECTFYTNTGLFDVTDSIRPISDVEKEALHRKNTMLKTAIAKYEKEITFASESYGSPNIDIVRINDTLFRLYFLQGTTKPNTIPFGNDYSVDFDENLNPIAFRRYHKSLIDSPTIDGQGNTASFVMHSHLKDNPYMTPTDICNFLLYRPKDIGSFMVYSVAFGCFFEFIPEVGIIIK